MKCRWSVILLPVVLLSLYSSGQSRYSRLTTLYDLVDKADSMTTRSLKTFYLDKFLGNDFTYKETWRYGQRNGRIVFFQVDYTLDSTEFTEVYYLNREDLVCSEEYQKINYSFFEDELKWGGVYYFQGSTPMQVVTLGKRETNNGFSPALAALYRFDKRFSELKRHMPMLP